MKQLFTIFIIAVFFLTSCSQKGEDYIPENVIASYMPNSIGKYVIYRLDSTIFDGSGSIIVTKKYQVKQTITAAQDITPINKVLTIQRQIRNEEGSDTWRNNGIIYIYVFKNRLETVENNLRIINLALPFSLDANYKWQGNSYLPSKPYKTIFGEDMSAGIDMNKWLFKYSSNADTAINNITYNNVWTVKQNDFNLNMPPTSNTQIGLLETGEEKYAAGIGLIYKDLQIYDYQGAHADNPTPQYTGFGIKMWAIEHN